MDHLALKLVLTPLLIGAAMLTGTALAKGGGAFSGVFGRGIAHLTIYFPALALYLIVLPRIYGFSTLGHLPQIFALATVFLLATSFMGQAIGAWFTRPENATLLLLATSLPQFFLVGIFNPIKVLPPYLEILSRISPMRYAVDLARGAFYAGRPEYSRTVLDPPLLDLAVMAGMFVVFLVVGTALFVRNERNR